MSAAAAVHGNVRPSRRKSCWIGTPEIYFAKPIDNSRLVKVEDPGREFTSPSRSTIPAW